MSKVGYCVQGAIEFGMDSRRLIQRCTKPDAKEFKKIAVACAIGFSIMGFLGAPTGWSYPKKVVIFGFPYRILRDPQKMANKNMQVFRIYFINWPETYVQHIMMSLVSFCD